MKSLIYKLILALVTATVLSPAHATLCDSTLVDDQSFSRYVSPKEAESLRSYAIQSRWDDPLGDHIEYTTAALRFISNSRFFKRSYYPYTGLEQIILTDWLESPLTNSRAKNLYLSEAVVADLEGCSTNTSEFCFEAESKHAETLFRPLLTGDMSAAHAGETVFINVEGLGIVGAVKQFGEPTMIALKDVKNSKGYPVLIRGAIYDISKTLFKDQLVPLKQDGVKLSVIDVQQLTVRPGRFLNPSSAAFSDLYTPFQNSSLSERMILRRQWREFRVLLLEVEKAANQLLDSK